MDQKLPVMLLKKASLCSDELKDGEGVRTGSSLVNSGSKFDTSTDELYMRRQMGNSVRRHAGLAHAMDGPTKGGLKDEGILRAASFAKSIEAKNACLLIASDPPLLPSLVCGFLSSNYGQDGGVSAQRRDGGNEP